MLVKLNKVKVTDEHAGSLHKTVTVFSEMVAQDADFKPSGSKYGHIKEIMLALNLLNMQKEVEFLKKVVTKVPIYSPSP